MKNLNLTGHFLIAMPAMVDPYFAKTLTYVCEHTDQGALGVVVNRPIDMTVQTLFEQMDVALEMAEVGAAPVYFGGPVQMDRGFVLHQPVGNWQSTLPVEEQIGLTTSKDILVATGEGRGPNKMLITLGYAGWAPGQLEHEIKQNGWLTVKADLSLVFDVPSEERLVSAMELLGINFAMLSEEAGHA